MQGIYVSFNNEFFREWIILMEMTQIKYHYYLNNLIPIFKYYVWDKHNDREEIIIDISEFDLQKYKYTMIYHD